MFNVMDSIESQSIDLLLTDFPYGILNKRNKWDSVIDYDKFWEHEKIICKPKNEKKILKKLKQKNEPYFYLGKIIKNKKKIDIKNLKKKWEF